MEPNKRAGDALLQPAQVVKIAWLVDYKSGPVVVREIFKIPTGSVTVFAFDEGQGTPSYGPQDILFQNK